MSTKVLTVGEPAPWFVGRTASKPRYAFDTVAGRYVAMLFYGSSRDRVAAAALERVAAHRDIFDDQRACFFGVTTDPADEGGAATQDDLPGIRHFLDFDLAVSRAYGCAPPAGKPGAYQSGWFILDPMLRVLVRFPVSESEAALMFIRTLPPPDAHAGSALHAPVLIVPRVFESALCRHLIDLYDRQGGEDSGFMREIDGKTKLMLDHGFKRRADMDIADEALCRSLSARIADRLKPELRRAFHFDATRMERYIVACYDAEPGGFFRPHRDNTTKGTAHRRFAVTINLNAEEYEGGDLRFPEFGSRTYRAPTGGAVVFSCSLLHEALPVTRGRRYAFLPFLYDEAAAAIREANNEFLDEGVGAYSR